MLILAGKKLKDLNEFTQTQNNEIKHLDVSSNLLKSGKEFVSFPNLETLIIDNNYYFNLNDFPQLPKLVTLSANKNNFNNLEILIDECKLKFPKLTHLSLIKNPICPMFNGEEEYQTYRTTLIKQIRSLKNVDGVAVDPKEADPNYFKQQKLQLQQQQQLQNNQDEAKGKIEFNQKYQKPGTKTIKQRSEGNRFVKNNQL
ncbi:unnamed protein product [Paramecium sonneborni]|uniref:Uncharacterized protein n=1 Tax=Paramecium sonneborni TaxID=65129 RepID=A0A8S1KHU0_9CILI|nr:unnamed protein product [Paramecium sonneborni]